MYEDRTQNYDPEIHEEYMYLIQDTTIPLPHHLQPCTDYTIDRKATILNFLL